MIAGPPSSHWTATRALGRHERARDGLLAAADLCAYTSLLLVIGAAAVEWRRRRAGDRVIVHDPSSNGAAVDHAERRRQSTDPTSAQESRRRSQGTADDGPPAWSVGRDADAKVCSCGATRRNPVHAKGCAADVVEPADGEATADDA